MSGRKVVDCGLSKAQRKVLLRRATIWLVDKAADLELRSKEKGPGRPVKEVMALGRLVSGLEDGEVEVPDKVVGDLLARRITETNTLEELTKAKKEYEKEQEEHEAWVKLLAIFAGREGTSGG